jgi:hypothetical protein
MTECDGIQLCGAGNTKAAARHLSTLALGNGSDVYLIAITWSAACFNTWTSPLSSEAMDKSALASESRAPSIRIESLKLPAISF